MFRVRRKVLQSAGRLGRSQGNRQYSEKHDNVGDKVHDSEAKSTMHHNTGPVNEPLGSQLYIVLGLLSASYVVFALSRKSEDGTVPGITRIIEKYSYYKDKWAARNALHTAMIEQAALDKNLFYSSKTSTHVDLRFPEIFNTGSPFNVSAGRGWANLDKLVAHYEKSNAEEEERKARALEARGGSK